MVQPRPYAWLPLDLTNWPKQGKQGVDREMFLSMCVMDLVSAPWSATTQQPAFASCCGMHFSFELFSKS